MTFTQLLRPKEFRESIGHELPFKKQFILLVLAGSLSVGASADIYKWVDKYGNVHFGDEPPEHVQSERVQIESSTESDSAEEIELQQRRLKQSSKEADSRMEARREKAAAERTEKEQRLSREVHCLKARIQLAILLELRLPAYRDESGQFRAQWIHDMYQGTREYLDEKTRSLEISRARLEVGKLCREPNDEEAQNIARLKWIMSERCAAARAELEHVELQKARSPRQEIQEKRQLVEAYCSEQPGNKIRYRDLERLLKE